MEIWGFSSIENRVFAPAVFGAESAGFLNSVNNPIWKTTSRPKRGPGAHLAAARQGRKRFPWLDWVRFQNSAADASMVAAVRRTITWIGVQNHREAPNRIAAKPALCRVVTTCPY